jgi:lipopolysaccharide/colanic/teichoic acid biosynthesis glycosyltransferase
MTDEVGMMSQTQTGAVLPDTSHAGALCFAQDVERLAMRRGIQAGYSIHTYPPSRVNGHAGSGRNGNNGNGHGGNGHGGNGHRQFAESRAKGESAASERHSAVGTATMQRIDASPIIATNSMDAMLTLPTPWWKRATDILGSLFGLVIFAPFRVVAAALIRLTSKGPVLFTQRRAGLGGGEFTIFKFRTMVTNAEAMKAALRKDSEQDGPAFKMKEDPRITLIGRFLRCTSLDELPQFLNVLLGNMSLVGPRPLPIEEAEECGQWHRRRLSVAPGLTCIWQVRGRSRVGFDDWMRMDMQYIHNRSFLYDLKILLLTIPAVVLRRGAH